MPKAKIAITISKESVASLDRLVGEKAFRSRSQFVEEAVQEKLERLKKTQLAEACARLNASEEQALAEEGLAKDVLEWPKY